MLLPDKEVAHIMFFLYNTLPNLFSFIVVAGQPLYPLTADLSDRQVHCNKIYMFY